MNRKEEYNRLLTELDNTPPALENTVARARARARKAGRIHHFFMIPAGGIAVFFIVFVVTVNLSTSFAMACGRIPLIRELAAAVAFSPSLSAAVLNEYVQPIELEQTKNGVTMRVEYVIVDQKQLNVFYSLRSAVYPNMDAIPSVGNSGGTLVEEYVVSTKHFDAENGELRQITIDFMDENVPDELSLTCEVYDTENGNLAPMETSQQAEQFICSFTFSLSFDPCYTSRGDIVTLNQGFTIDGQSLTATDIEIYPTHIRLNLMDDEKNTAWLQSISFYLENENGERFESVKNGITASGSIDSPFIASHRLESSFFSKNKSLMLYITDAVWLDKDMERVKIDLANNAADELPEGVKLEQTVRNSNSWQLTFSGTNHQLFRTSYYDETGKEYEFDGWSMRPTDYINEENGENAGAFKIQFSLEDYPFDTVYLSPCFSRTVILEIPVDIKVK